MADKRRNLGIPSGVVFPFAGATAPYGYLICDGRPVLQSEYPSLFLSVGFSHGDGSQNSDGTASGFTSATHFNLPDYRGRFLRGVDGLAGNDPDKSTRLASKTGGNAGNNVGSVQDQMTGDHTHLSSAFSDNGWPSGSGDRQNSYYFMNASKGTDYQLPIEGNGGSETRPKNVNVNYIIKV